MPELDQQASVAGESQLVPLPMGRCLTGDVVEQLTGPFLIAPPRRDEHGSDVLVASGGFRDGRQLVEAPLRLREEPGHELGQSGMAQSQRTRDDGAVLPGLGVQSPGEGMQSDVVGQNRGVRAAGREPLEELGSIRGRGGEASIPRRMAGAATDSPSSCSCASASRSSSPTLRAAAGGSGMSRATRATSMRVVPAGASRSLIWA